MDDYLLGYITSELLTNIEYHCKRRTPGPTLEVIAHLFVPILGKDRATEALERIERELRLNQSDSELGVGFRIGDMVSRISFGEKTFEDNSYVEDARLQAPIIAKERESLGKLSNDMCTFLYLDRINFDKHITDNYSTPEILKLKGS